MNLGRAIVSTILKTEDVAAFLDVGMDLQWIRTPEATSVFDSQDRQAYTLLLEHYRSHGTVNPDIFRESFPEVSYRLTKRDYKPSELIAESRQQVSRFLLLDILNTVVDMDDSAVDEAVDVVVDRAQRLRAGVLALREGSAVALADFDFDSWVDEFLEEGIPLGIEEIDSAFGGFQPGQLITLVGRQKSTKSTLMAWSAIAAWEAGYEALFYNVELDLRYMRQKMFSIGAHVSPERLRKGPGSDEEQGLWKYERRRLGEFYDRLTDEGVPFWVAQKFSAFTVEDVRADIERYNPHVIYIDGFYFMEDRDGDSAATNWKAIEHIAADLKALAMETEKTIIISTQSQEKQQGKKKTPGIEAKTIQGGTGLLKSSDLVLGLDVDGRDVFINDVRNRYGHLDTLQINWDWNEMQMEVIPFTYDFDMEEV